MQGQQDNSLPENLDQTENDVKLDEKVFRELEEIRVGKQHTFYKAKSIVPYSVDLSHYLHFIRRQGFQGCWGYSMLAVWDIMNEMVCPFSPNLSMRLWLMFHRRHDLWCADPDHCNHPGSGIFSPDGRFHEMKAPEWGFFQSFGNTTEGTEPTLYAYPSGWTDGGWTTEGINEAYNYRLRSDPQNIEISSQSFINCLADGKPIRLCYNSHYIAVVGYDNEKQEFKYVNSNGDKWNNGGFGIISFGEIDKKQTDNSWLGKHTIDSAEIVEIHPPRPVPVARINIKHSDHRSNVHLWIGAEDSPHPLSQIWPQGWNDNSRNLHFTVRLPSEFIWPPSNSNRIVLRLYDAGTYSKTGGELVDFSINFGLHNFRALQLPIKFNTGDNILIYIP